MPTWHAAATKTFRATAVVTIAAIALSFTPYALAHTCEPAKQVTEAAPEQVRAFFKSKRWNVVTFLGYSGAEYEDPTAMLKHAGRTLDRLSPKRTAVNIGATAQGIGAVYELAKRRGFTTTGIVSTQAKEQGVALSPCVDFVFYVTDPTWGGYVPGTTTLTPTSEAMVTSSDVLVAIGGGEVAVDELLAAKRIGKPITFIPADMNQGLALAKAASRGLPAPTDFRGAAHAAFSGGALPRDPAK
jgi:hypothetical protein